MKTTHNHTPGPWRAAKGDEGDWDIFSDNAPSGRKLPAQTFGPDAQANAHLIAAAPELFQAAKILEDLMQNWQSDFRNKPRKSPQLCKLAE